jgi:hypothetical protein
MKPLLPIVLATLASAQAPSVPVAWDVARAAVELSAQAARLAPILEQLTPAAWLQQGAPQAYVDQWRTSRDELGFLAESAKTFERQPEKLSAALDTYFRLQGLERQLTSLADGVRKYQNPAVGDLLVAVMGENTGNREGLRQYISDLAAQKEQEFSVADREAQRCRATVNRQPAPAPAKRNK